MPLVVSATMPLCLCRGRQPARGCDVRGCTSPTARLDQESRSGQRCFRFKTLPARWVARHLAHSPGLKLSSTSQIGGRGPLWKFPANGAQTVAPSSISRAWLYPPSLEPRPPAAPPPAASTSTPSSTPIHSSFFTTHFLSHFTRWLLNVRSFAHKHFVFSKTVTILYRSFTFEISISRLPVPPTQKLLGPFEYKQQHQVSGELFIQAHDQSLYTASQLQYRQSIQIVYTPTFEFNLFPHTSHKRRSAITLIQQPHNTHSHIHIQASICVSPPSLPPHWAPWLWPLQLRRRSVST